MSSGQTEIQCPCGHTVPIPYTYERAPVSAIGETRFDVVPDYALLDAHIATHRGCPRPGLGIAS